MLGINWEGTGAGLVSLHLEQGADAAGEILRVGCQESGPRAVFAATLLKFQAELLSAQSASTTHDSTQLVRQFTDQ